MSKITVGYSFPDAEGQSTWVELHVEYRESLKRVDRYRTCMREEKDDTERTAGEMVELELLGGMKSDLEEAVRELKRRTLYEFKTLSEEDLSNPILTERQREVARLRQSYSCTEVAKMLGISPKTVFTVYKQALRKIEKCKEQERKGVPTGLSPQQGKIYELYRKGKTKSEISEILDISVSSVKTHLRHIKKKMGVKKL
ncbi:MAG: hypothetical protein H0Z24_09835 [Thermosipho sp. (in: Bacteria)]|nr:hypothetical protein [Thermosipho sp. (in: thermotogales)]